MIGDLPSQSRLHNRFWDLTFGHRDLLHRVLPLLVAAACCTRIQDVRCGRGLVLMDPPYEPYDEYMAWNLYALRQRVRSVWNFNCCCCCTFVAHQILCDPLFDLSLRDQVSSCETCDLLVCFTLLWRPLRNTYYCTSRPDESDSQTIQENDVLAVSQLNLLISWL